MPTKYLPLIKLLFTNESWSTAASVADQLGISLRTAKSYVRDVNSLFPGIIMSSSKGYHINAELASGILKDTRSSIPQTARERAAYIINRAIKQETPVLYFDLCDELFISMSSLRSIFQKIKKQLENYDLQLGLLPDSLTVRGIERNKRRLISALVYNESNENFVNLEIIQSIFPDIDIEFIRNKILEILCEYHYFINDYSLSNLVLHIAIAMDRIRNNLVQKDSLEPAETPQLYSHEYELSQKVIDVLEEHFHLDFSESETTEMALLLVSRATSLDYQSITVDNLENFIGRDCLNLVNGMVADISAYLYINLNEPEFLIRFALHIKNLLTRARNEHLSKNPLGDTLKASCPLIYDHAVWCSSLIRERTGLIINDDEIGYIAFHLGSTLEAQKELATKLSAVIYCPTYYNADQRLYNTLSRRFSTELMIANIVTSESDLARINTPDLIICTAPINALTNTPAVQVQPFLSEHDINAIRQKITHIQQRKKKQVFAKYLRKIMLPELFQHGKGFSCKEDAIHELSEHLKKAGFVNENFEADILEREYMSSTGFTNFAIPHTIKMNSNRTGMYIYVSDSPTNWGGTPVSLIIMLCFNREDRYIFNETFEPLTTILTDHTNLKKALAISDYNAFIDFLCECL